MLEIPKLNITFKQGDDDILNMTFRYDDGTEVDFSKIKRIDMHGKVGKTVVFKLSSTTSDIEVISVDTKTIRVKVPHTLTEKAAWKKCDYDIQVVEEDQGIRTICEGHICIDPDVTFIPNVKK